MHSWLLVKHIEVLVGQLEGEEQQWGLPELESGRVC